MKLGTGDLPGTVKDAQVAAAAGRLLGDDVMAGIKAGADLDFCGGKAAAKKRLLAQDASRTMQPIKGFNLDALKLEAALEEKAQIQQKANLQILKTHRFISDLHDEEAHHHLGSSLSSLST